MKIRPRAGASAFTLIELLVVIAIIALLIAILLPALGRAREEGRKVKEESLAHQMVIGMAAYYTDSKDKVMPAGPHWAWDHAPPNEYSIFPPDPYRNGVGQGNQQGLLEGSCTKVWTLYFIGYTNWRLSQIQLDKVTRDAFESRPSPGQANGNSGGLYWQYLDSEAPVAYAWHPTLGMNGTYVGGAYSFGAFRGQGANRPNHPNDVYGDPTPGGNPKVCGGNFYVRSAADARMPSNLLFFASSRGGDVSGSGYWNYGQDIPNSGTIRPGYWQVCAPVNSPLDSGNAGAEHAVYPEPFQCMGCQQHVRQERSARQLGHARHALEQEGRDRHV